MGSWTTLDGQDTLEYSSSSRLYRCWLKTLRGRSGADSLVSLTNIGEEDNNRIWAYGLIS